ncbi:hypothetical protein KM043_014127 [Ampulex compressa]|nr:hypothetical protein KM043_014127 [Ampulex compressa]
MWTGDDLSQFELTPAMISAPASPRPTKPCRSTSAKAGPRVTRRRFRRAAASDTVIYFHGHALAFAVAQDTRDRAGQRSIVRSRKGSPWETGAVMKLLVFVASCLLQASVVLSGSRPNFVSDEMIASAASVVNACQTQTQVTTADIEAVRNDQWPETRQLKCYMYCLWEQFGLVDDKRELSLNGMLTFFQRMPAYRAEVQKAISECKGIGKYFANGDNCEYAYTFNKCYAELSPKTYYLF